jgi:hypothetical protein
MHWMQRIRRPTAKGSVLMKATDFAAVISRTENGGFYPSQLCNSHSTGSPKSSALGFPLALDGTGDAARIYACSTGDLIPPKSQTASVRTAADRCGVHFAPLPPELSADPTPLCTCLASTAPTRQVEDWLAAAGFSDIRIAIKPGSRELVASWAPGRGIEDYVASATFAEYYQADQAIRTTEDLHRLVHDMARVARDRYAQGRRSQQEVYKAEVDITRLSTEIVRLETRRRSAAARLNALLARPIDAPLSRPGQIAIFALRRGACARSSDAAGAYRQPVHRRR